jgi:hypothetical protein
MEPKPGVDSTHNLPEWSCTIFLQVANPVPDTLYSDCLCKRLKGLNISLKCPCSIPMPLSLTNSILLFTKISKRFYFGFNSGIPVFQCIGKHIMKIVFQQACIGKAM